MEDSVMYKQKVTLMENNDVNNSSAVNDTPHKLNPSDVEISFRVDFKTKQMKFTEVDGIRASDNAELVLFERVKCKPHCNTEGDCADCTVNNIYSTPATAPQGKVDYENNKEYLLCFRCDKNPMCALLSIIPKDQKVEIEEKTLLSYWFRHWFEREKMNNPTGCVQDLLNGPLRDYIEQDNKQGASDKEKYKQKPTIDYIPNMQIIYQVKKDTMTVTLPKPEQLKRDLEIVLLARDPETNRETSRQSAYLSPGDNTADKELNAQRNIPYALQVKLRDRGDSVELLDFITEKKILRVQEAKDAPKRMNFLMERRVEQRGTFILHITFDEKIVDVGASPVGEFHLDVDVEKNTMTIGTTSEYKNRTYKVEKIVGNPAESEVLQAQKEELFMGGVDHNSLTIAENIPIERLSDYLISVLDPASNTLLPTTVLAFQKNALFVKEIKSSDVRLHVTVQRQSNTSNDRFANANNEDPITMVPIRRADKTGEGPLYYCPFKAGWTKFRILHKVKTIGDVQETGNEMDFDLSSNFNTKIDVVSAPMGANTEDGELDFHLDVDMNKMQARLLPNKNTKNDKIWFVVDEKTQKTGMIKTLPCQLNQILPIQSWCDYAVKVVDGQKLQLIFSFSISDKEVVNAKPCNPAVRLTRKQLHE